MSNLSEQVRSIYVTTRSANILERFLTGITGMGRNYGKLQEICNIKYWWSFAIKRIEIAKSQFFLS